MLGQSWAGLLENQRTEDALSWNCDPIRQGREA